MERYQIQHLSFDTQRSNVISCDSPHAESAAAARSNSSYTDFVSKRLQALIPDKEMEGLRRLARREKISPGEWVRKALQEVVETTIGRN